MDGILTKIYYIYALLTFYIKSWWYWILSILTKRGIIRFDNGKSVRIVRQIAEGGFSVVFEAIEIDTFPTKKRFYENKRYALKRVLCADNEAINKCREEASIHSR